MVSHEIGNHENVGKRPEQVKEITSLKKLKIEPVRIISRFYFGEHLPQLVMIHGRF